MLTNKKIGFIGAGNMGLALIKGLLKKELLEPQNIIVSDLDEKKLQIANCKLQVMVARNNKEAVEGSDIIILAVKPQDIGEALKEISNCFPALSLSASGGLSKLVISIAAGITTGYIEEHLEKGIPVIRVMPNAPAFIGEGMTAISLGRFAGEEEERITEEIFRGVGETVKVREELIDAVTALGGSGPAYIFAIMESLVEAGVKEGLSPHLAQRLVGQTVLGAVRMVMETGERISVLREMVASPGGTTEAALRVFKEKGLGEILAEGVRAAAKRAKELSKEGTKAQIRLHATR